jgi:hypothetical protein
VALVSRFGRLLRPAIKVYEVTSWFNHESWRSRSVRLLAAFLVFAGVGASAAVFARAFLARPEAFFSAILKAAGP